MSRLSVREHSLIMALLALSCVGLGIGWYLDRSVLANDLAKLRSDFRWLMEQSVANAPTAEER